MSLLEPPDVHSSATDDGCLANFTHFCPTVSCDDPPTCRPGLARIKSCLKSSPSHSGASTPTTEPDDSNTIPLIRKRVAFSEDGTEQVYAADEWDRTPAEIAQRLTYEDVLELKMIQRELPRAEQPYDPLSSRPYSGVFLSHVPIPLLPLNPTTICASSLPTLSPSPASPSVLSSPCTPSRSNTSSPSPSQHNHNTSSPSPSQIHTNCSFRPLPLQEQPRDSPSKPPPAAERLVVRPHNIPVPPPPVTLRAYRYPPPPPSSASTKPTASLPPKRTFTFLPLLDDSSNSSGSPSPMPSANNTPAASLSPLAQSPTTSSPPQATASSAPSDPTAAIPTCIASPGFGQGSDADRPDLGYASDCSVTDVSTPSLTTASLASNSPPESPGVECDFHDGERVTDKDHLGLRNISAGNEDNDSFVVNLDIDVDVDPCDSYFPRSPPSMSMHPIHQRGRSTLTPTHISTPKLPPQTTRSRVPVSSFHARHPHLNLPRPSQRPQASAARGPDADTDALADPTRKLRLHAIPSPDLPVPSPLELPGRPTTTPRQQVTQKRMLVSLLPLAEPVGEVCIKVEAKASKEGGADANADANSSVLFESDDQLLPSLSRAQSRP